MRILALTAGAANMYCGSCLRDNALARELMRQGHQATLVPMYTPTKTDTENVSGKRVFFGGISIWLQQNVPVFRTLPAWMDQLFDAPWALRLATKGSIEVDPKLLGELSVSTLKGERGFQRKEIRKLLDWLRTEPRPDVIALPYTLLIALAEPLRRELKAPVLCTLQGEDLFLEGLQEPWRSQCLDLIRSQTPQVDRFIAVSTYYAGFMSEYLGIVRDRIDVVPLGVDVQGFDPLPKTESKALRVGYFARLAPEKGLDILCEAVSRMSEPAELHVAGYMPPEQSKWVQDLQSRYGFRYEGSPDLEGKIRFLQSVDVLSVPTRYREPKGLFALEAMAVGTPVVQPAHGAFPELLNKTRGGILTEPGCAVDLALKLDALARDRGHVRQLGANGADGVRQHFRLQTMAERTVDVYRSVLSSVECNPQR
ncbi:MAG TPA: glycosyltransferase family 4 protein [Bryobacteraceae bacterium]|nr:glycosyltransferase family 4 protein [Bryobacteraceae bacterium]